MKKFLLTIICFSSLLLTGCATSTSEISINTEQLTLQNNTQSTKTVFVRNIIDERKFDPDTNDPSVPSVDYETEDEKDHAIGRKRNAYGMALGSIVLTEEQSVRSLTRDAIVQALIDNGYNVIKNEKDITSKTLIVDISIKKFWAWMKPGFWSITLSNDIVADINVVNTSKEKQCNIKGEYKEGFQTGTAGNYTKVIQKSFNRFYLDAKDQFSKID